MENLVTVLEILEAKTVFEKKFFVTFTFYSIDL